MIPRLSVVTLFPEFFQAFRAHSVLGRAVEKGLFDFELVNPRQWGLGAYRSVDDYSYGGEGGMTLRPEPLAAALEYLSGRGKPFVVYPSPQGAPLTQDLVESLPRDGHLAFFCGHYEGLDERFVRKHVDLEISLGDFVLTGGELPTMVIIDAWARLIPGVVGNETSVHRDSFYDGMLDTCHFTRPPLWEGEAVPEVLTSGNAAAIERWRRAEALRRTVERRPDLLARAGLMPYLDHEVYLGWVADRCPTAEEQKTLLDVARHFGLARVLLAPREAEAAPRWREAVVSFDGVSVKVFPTPGAMARFVARKGGTPLIVQPERADGVPWLEGKRRLTRLQGPALFLFGADRWEGALPLWPQGDIDGGLPPVALLSTTLDRFFGARS